MHSQQEAVDRIISALEQATAYIHTTVHRIESPGCREDWRDCNLGQCGTTNGAFSFAQRVAAGYR